MDGEIDRITPAGEARQATLKRSSPADVDVSLVALGRYYYIYLIGPFKQLS
jgi:hypothetical protein